MFDLLLWTALLGPVRDQAEKSCVYRRQAFQAAADDTEMLFHNATTPEECQELQRTLRALRVEYNRADREAEAWSRLGR